MTTLNKRAAMDLVNEIWRANVTGHATAASIGAGDDIAIVQAGFLGGMEAVLRHFLVQQGCSEAASALGRAMNEMPTSADISARMMKSLRLGSEVKGDAA